MDLGSAGFVLVVFLAVVLMIEGAYLLWNDHKGPDVRRLERRLRTLSAGDHGGELMALLKQRNLSDSAWLERLLLAVPRIAAIDRWLQQSGLSITVARLMLISAGCISLALVLGWVARAPLGIVFSLAALGAALPLVFVAHARAGRLRRFDEQLPDALDLIARALRAGHAFPSAMQMVGTESMEPIATEFQITFEEINYGVSANDAMLNLATRVPSMDLRYFIIAVILQRETGGNLAELLGNLSQLIRERFKLLGRIRVLAAEGRLSAYILTTLPFAAALVIFAVNPKFMSVLWRDPAGLQVIWACLVMLVLGVLWMWRIVKIRV